jgi:Ca-activated chloride channel family protein
MTALPVWAWNTGRSARAGNNEGALSSYSNQIYWGDLGPASWVAHYNAGTQHVKLDHPDEAVAELRIAWDRVPKAKQIEDGRIETYSYECTVRMNLALALEKQGDAAMSTDRAHAAEIYKEMGEVVAPCQSAASTQNQQNQNQQGGGGGADADKAHDRAQQKQQQAQNQENQDKDKDKDKQNQDKDKQNQDKDKQNQDNKDKDKQNQDQQNQNQDKDKQNQDKSKDPYQGETKEQRAKREEMQKRQEQTDREERQNKDRKRGTGGTGAW